jgi:hypothetical protein
MITLQHFHRVRVISHSSHILLKPTFKEGQKPKIINDLLKHNAKIACDMRCDMWHVTCQALHMLCIVQATHLQITTTAYLSTTNRMHLSCVMSTLVTGLCATLTNKYSLLVLQHKQAPIVCCHLLVYCFGCYFHVTPHYCMQHHGHMNKQIAMQARVKGVACNGKWHLIHYQPVANNTYT